MTMISWIINMVIYNYATYPKKIILNTADKYKLVDTFGGCINDNNVYEWDYTFHYNSRGYDHKPVNKQDAYDMIKKYFTNQLAIKYKNNKENPVPEVTGHYYYPHYAAKWGGDKISILFAEIGENIKSANTSLAFVRGAAKQYNKTWALQISLWYGPSVLDYSIKPIWVTPEYHYSGPNNGHSIELAKRMYYLTYISGANICDPEGSSVNWFQNEIIQSDNTFNLSPLGLIGQKFYEVTHRFTNRGTQFVPMVIMLDQYHGLGCTSNTNTFNGNVTLEEPILSESIQQGDTDSTSKKTIFGFDDDAGSLMTKSLFNTLWPGSFSPMPWDESNYYLTNSSYGDLFDVMLDDAQNNVLENYPFLYLSGNISLTNDLCQILVNYVNNGGTLIINSGFIKTNTVLPVDFLGVQFQKTYSADINNINLIQTNENLAVNTQLNITPLILNTAKTLIGTLNSSNNSVINLVTQNKYGKGNVIVVGIPYLQNTKIIDFLIKSIVYPTFPLVIDGNIEYAINKTDSGWVLMLINNLGIKKQPTSPPVIDPNQNQNIKITLRDSSVMIDHINNVIDNYPICPDTSNSFSVIVNSADVKIFDIHIKKTTNNSNKIKYTINDDWKTGFLTTIQIQNTTDQPIKKWTITFSFLGNQKITNLWNATFTQVNNNVTISNLDWNSTILVGDTVVIGFQASYSGDNKLPTNFTLNSDPISVD